MPEHYASLRNPDGTLKFWAGSIAVHAFSLEFLERVSTVPLPYHIAYKKVPYVDLKMVSEWYPTEPNAIKFERFIFDILPEARRSIVVEIDPADGLLRPKMPRVEKADTPEDVRAAMITLHTRWLRSAGVQVAEKKPPSKSARYMRWMWRNCKRRWLPVPR